MRSSRRQFLITLLTVLLATAVWGQAMAPRAEAGLQSCAGEHHENGKTNDSHCPCACHHQEVGLTEWQVVIPVQLALVCEVLEQPLSAVEAPPASIEYPPQLA